MKVMMMKLMIIIKVNKYKVLKMIFRNQILMINNKKIFIIVIVIIIKKINNSK